MYILETIIVSRTNVIRSLLIINLPWNLISTWAEAFSYNPIRPAKSALTESEYLVQLLVVASHLLCGVEACSLSYT